MTAPVINALRQHLPDLRLTLQTAIPRDWLQMRYDGDFDYVGDIPDFGFEMENALVVKMEESALRYKAMHDDLDAIIEGQAALLKAAQVDLVFANIPYVTLLAAQRAEIPALAFSCLNWADLYRHFCSGRPESDGVEAAMLAGYQSAKQFLRPAPSMPMARLNNSHAIGPIARRGHRWPDKLADLLDIEEDSKIGLITFGGVDVPLPLNRFPRLPGWRWITTSDPAGHPDIIARSAVDMDFTDILRSCDVVVGKPGYGTFSEAAVNGVSVLYLPRPNWPEAPCLVDWLTRNGRCLSITPDDLFDADALLSQLRKLFSFPVRPLIEPTGAQEAVQAILQQLTDSPKRHM